jgi:hypothetical protein
MQQQPGSKLHQPRGQPHAFGGVGERGGALEFLGFLPAGTVEIGRGLLHQRHAVTEQIGKHVRIGKPRTKRHRLQFVH